MEIKRLSDYKYKYDLHVHTAPVSPCAEIDAETTVLNYKEIGFTGIVITNHFSRNVFNDSKSKNEWLESYIKDYHDTKKFGEKYGLDVLLGIEIRFPENANDYLVYGVDEQDVMRAYDFLDEDYKNFYKNFKNEKNLIVQAHPFRKGMVLQDISYLDGIETYNLHPHHNSQPAVAVKLASSHPEMIVTGGTDFHHANHQGMCGMCCKERLSSSFELAALLKSRDYLFEVWGNKIVPYMDLGK